MNPDIPRDPRQELEARLSALILGQLPEEQANELQQQLNQDPELLKLYHRLQAATELIREAAATADPANSRGPVPRLSQQRREQLLASFKTITPGVRTRSGWSFKSWAVPAAAAAMIMLLGGELLLSFTKAKSRSQQFTSLTGRRLADMESEQAAAGRYSLADGVDASSAMTALPPATELAMAEARGIVPVVVAPSAGATLSLSGGTGGGGKGGGGANPPQVVIFSADGTGLIRNPGHGVPVSGGTTPPQVAAPSPGVTWFANTRGGVVGGKGESAPTRVAAKVETAASQAAGDVIVEPPSSLPTVALAVPASPPADKEQLAAQKSWSYQAPAEARAELRKETSTLLGAEIAQAGRQIVTEGLQFATNSFANHSSGTNWGDYDKAGNADLIINDISIGNANLFGHYNFITPDSRKLAEASASSLGYGVAMNDDNGKVLSQQLDEFFAKDLPRDAKQATEDSLARYARRGDSADSSKKTPASAGIPSEEVPVQVLVGEVQATIPDSTAVPSQAEVARRAGYLGRKPANGPAEIQAGKPAQLAQITEEKSKGLELMEKLDRATQQSDLPAARPALPAPVPLPEILTLQNRFSTFSMNVSDVSFKLAAAALEKGVLPDAGTIRSEEFINAFNYHDPEPAPGSPLAFAWEIARSPFAHNRDLIRFSVKTAAQGRQQGQPLNIVVLLDNSGSMERADRARIIQKAFRALATQLQAQDRLSIVLFARTAQLWVDGVPGDQASSLAEGIGNLVPQGGTNLEEAMNLAYQTALRHYAANGINRVVLLTDGAANLGDVDPAALKQKVESFRKQGVALDCFGIGWEGYNDELMETLSRNGDGRYGFINTPEEAESSFVSQLAGALHVAASDVKVQVEFNPDRVNIYRQIGYAKHQLTKEQFRDNTVDAAEIGAAESGNAVYSIELNPTGLGPIATLRVRYKVPGTSEYKELEWLVPFNGNSPALEQASPAMKLATTASVFSEWLASNPYAGDVTTAGLLKACEGVPQAFANDARAKQLEWMIRQAQSLSGR